MQKYIKTKRLIIKICMEIKNILKTDRHLYSQHNTVAMILKEKLL